MLISLFSAGYLLFIYSVIYYLFRFYYYYLNQAGPRRQTSQGE